MRNKSRNVLFVSLTALSLVLILLLSCDSDISKNSGISDDTITAVKYEKIYSKILNEERKLIIHLPPGYEKTSQAYPVLYLLDADWDSLFLSSVATSEYLNGFGLIPKMIIVGICNTVRNRDMIPIKREDRPESGGSKNFLRFITEELMPYVKEQYRTVPYRLLFGGSNAGLFTVYALFENPEIFNACIAGSPMIGHCADFMHKLAEDAFLNKDLSSRFLYMIYGDDDLQGTVSYVPDLHQLIKTKSPEGFLYQMKIIENGGHVPFISLHDGLRSIFVGWIYPIDKIEKSNLMDIVEHYRHLTEKYGFEVEIPLDPLITLSYVLTEREDIPQTIETLLLACEIHPYSPDAFYYLGMAYELKGDLDLALTQYKKALEINPAYHMASLKIKELEERE